MDERRLRKFFHFTEDDMRANRHGQFSEEQKERLHQEAKAEQASARSSATILFVIAAAGLAVGLTVGSVAPSGIGRIFVFSLMGILWPSVWAGKGVQILRSARILQEPRLRAVSGQVRVVHHGEEEYTMQVEGLEFDLDGSPSGVTMDNDEFTIYYLEATDEILSVEYLIRGK